MAAHSWKCSLHHYIQYGALSVREHSYDRLDSAESLPGFNMWPQAWLIIPQRPSQSSDAPLSNTSTRTATEHIKRHGPFQRAGQYVVCGSAPEIPAHIVSAVPTCFRKNLNHLKV